MAELIWNAANPDEIAAVFGSYDSNLNLIQKKFQVVIVNRGTGVKITGPEENIRKAAEAMDVLLENTRKGTGINEQGVRYVVSMVADNAAEEVKTLTADAVSVTLSGKPIRPRTVGQKKYLDAIAANTIVLGIGPAGTGKTYLAVAMAPPSRHSTPARKPSPTPRPGRNAGGATRDIHTAPRRPPPSSPSDGSLTAMPRPAR